MDYWNAAFGDFDPQGDSNAALKFALDVIFMDERFDELAHLLADGDAIGAMEGEPGWTIERRDSGPSGQIPGYAGWPADASFRAYVDPEMFELANPEVFLQGSAFRDHVRRIVDAYVKQNPSDMDTIRPVSEFVQSS